MEHFQEAFTPRLVATEGEGKEWEVVIIQPGLSKNGFYYPADVLRKAVPLFENIRVCAYRYGDRLGNKFLHLPDHASLAKPGGFAENTVGWIKACRYGEFTDRDGKKGEGILGKLHVLEGHKWLRDNLADAWKGGQAHLMELSIDARGRGRDSMVDGRRVKVLEEILEVNSTDVVSHGAAGGCFVRLVAGLEKGRTHMDALYELVAQHRPIWLEGFEAPAEGADMKEYCLGVLESVKAQAEDYQQTIQASAEKDDTDNQHLLEVARGVATLNTLMRLIREGKMDEAMRLLRNWIAVYPMPDKGSPESQRRGFVSFPYGKPEPTGYPGPDKLQPYGKTSPERAAASADDAATAEPSKETTMDDATQAKLEEELAQLRKEKEEGKEREAAIEAKEQELATKERDMRVRERVGATDLPEKARARVIDALCAAEGEVTDEAIDAAVATERDYIKEMGFKEADKDDPNKDKGGQTTDLGDAHQDPDPTKVAVGQSERAKYVKAFEGFFDGGGQAVDGVEPFRSMRQAFGVICGPKLKGYYDNEDVADCIFAAIKMAFPLRSRSRCTETHLQRLQEGWNPYANAGSDYLHVREAIGTGDLPIAFNDALFKRLQKDFASPDLNDWRKIVSSIENLTDLTNNFKLVQLGYTGVLPTVNQNAPYQEFTTDPGEAVESLVPAKKGALLKLTWEDVLADRIGVIRAIPRRLGRSSARTIQQLVFDQIETNPVLDSDTTALIDATHSNHQTAALSYAALTTAIKQLRNQTEPDSAEKLGLNPRFLLVGPTKEQKAIELTKSERKANTAEDSTLVNFVREVGLMPFPTIGLGRSGTTEFRWYVTADPRDTETIVVGFLGGRDRPDIFVQSPVDTPVAGAAFEADQLTFKVRLGVGAKVANHQWIQGSLASS